MARPKVLLVENDRMVARAVLRILFRNDFTAHWAEGQSSAQQLIARELGPLVSSSTGGTSNHTALGVNSPALGFQSVEAVSVSCFDVGIFDIDLEDGDGVSLAAELLASGRVKQAVFHTGTQRTLQLERARSMGVVYLKPDNLEQLVSDLRQAFPDTPRPLTRSGYPAAKNPLRNAG